MSLAESLQQRWYQPVPPPAWTRPLEALYRHVVVRRAERFRQHPEHVVRLPVPVVVVGNVTLGGTGKTPLIIALAHALASRGFRPGVVSRGYGGTQREPHLLTEQDTPSRVGDEPRLIRQEGWPVAVGRQRPEAAARLVEAGCDVVLADDGLQHHRLGRDIDICVIDGERRLGNGHLLPAGPLREPASRLALVDFLVVNGGQPAPGEVPMQLEGGVAVPLAGGPPMSLSRLAPGPVHVVAGIGHPQRFFASLQAQGLQVVPHAFPDHHAFVPSDLSFGDTLPVLMTDKDAIKCQPFAQPHWWRVPVRARLPETFFDAVAARVTAAASGRSSIGH